MGSNSGITLQVSRRYSASPERVFDAWLDPARVRRFLFATPTGEMVRVDIDARVGGKFCITERRDGEDVDHVGEYRVIDRPSRLAFSFSVPKFSSEVTEVTIDIRALEEGCELTLTHVIPQHLAEYEERNKQGWTMILDQLESAV